MYEPIASSQSHGERSRQRSKGIHWEAPAIMISSFFAGGVCILGHHFFYQSLNHKPTSDAFQQQVNTGIGTAFAFLVKMFLVIAVGTGYWQVFWRQMKSRPVQVHRVDVMADILENAFRFLNARTVLSFPLLGFIAAITWLIPFAAIVPPAALTIELSPLSSETVSQRNMPVLDFNNTQYAQVVQVGSGAGFTKVYGGPQYNLNRVTSAAVSSGRLLQFDAPSPNSTYIIGFQAPALQCSNVPNDQRDVFTQNISTALDCTITDQYRKDKNPCYVQPLYMAWAPNDTNTVAFSGATGQDQGIPWSANTIGPEGGAPAALYVASQPTLENSAAWSFVGCELYNATYELNVTFTNGNQHINVTKLDYTNTVPYILAIDIVNSATITGVDPFTGEDAQVFTDLEQFAYQSVMDMMGKLITGQISTDFRGAAGQFNFTTTTGVMQTALIDTPELRPIFDIAQTCLDGASSCKETSTNKNLNITTPTNGTHLPQALEQMFQNMTLSLFSDSTYLTAKSASPSIDVTIRSPQNRYVYTSWQLLASYLAGLGVSAVGLAIGTWALFVNGVGYSQSFSTVLRTTRHARLDVNLAVGDTSGVQPTPKYLKEAKIGLGEVGDESGVELKQRSGFDWDEGERIVQR